MEIGSRGASNVRRSDKSYRAADSRNWILTWEVKWHRRPANFHEKSSVPIPGRARFYINSWTPVAALKASTKINIASTGWPFNQARYRNRGLLSSLPFRFFFSFYFSLFSSFTFFYSLATCSVATWATPDHSSCGHARRQRLFKIEIYVPARWNCEASEGEKAREEKRLRWNVREKWSC